MKIGEYEIERVERIQPSLGATFVRKRDALLVARETDSAYELELFDLVGLKSLGRKSVDGVTGVSRVGEKAALLKVRPSREERGDSRHLRKFEVRSLVDFSVTATFIEDKPGDDAAHPDGSRIAVAHDFGNLNIWDARTGELLSHYTSKGVGGVAYSEDGELFAAKEFAGKLQIFDASKPEHEPLRSVSVGKGEAKIAFHRHGHLVAVATSTTITIADADTAKVTASIKTTKKESQGAIGQMAFSPDGRLLVTSTLSDGAVGLWDLEQNRFIGHLLESKDPLTRVELDACGKLLLISSYESAEIYSISKARL